MQKKVQNIWRYLKKLTPLSSEEIMSQIAVILVVCRRNTLEIKMSNKLYYFFEIEFNKFLLNDLERINHEIYFKIPTPNILLELVELVLYLQEQYPDCEIYEEFYKNYSNERTSKEYMTPDYIAEFMIFLAGDVSNKNILDCCCGTGNILYKLLLKNTKLEGIDINRRVMTILFFRIFFKNKNDDIELNVEDYFSNNERKKYDLIFSDPPIGLKRHGGFNFKRMETALIYEILDSLTKYGKSVIVLPKSYLKLNLIEVQDLKVRLLNENLVEKIILLPERSFESTAIQILILVIDKNKNNSKIEVSFLEKKDIIELKNGSLKFKENILKNTREITEEEFYYNDFETEKVLEKDEILDKIEKLEEIQSEVFQQNKLLNKKIKMRLLNSFSIQNEIILEVLKKEIKNLEKLKKELQKFQNEIGEA